MLISVISDTHDNLPYIKKTIARLNRLDPGLVIHCGDFSAPFAASPYSELRPPLIAVFGNNDAEKDLIKERLSRSGKKVMGSFAKIDIDNRKIAVTHGDNLELLDALIETQAFDIICYGHTHQVASVKKGNMVVLNPGEVCGYLTGNHTFATINTSTMETKIIKL